MPLSSTPSTRRCRRCRQDLPLTTEYYGERANDVFGFATRCRTCTRQYRAELRASRRASGIGRTTGTPRAVSRQARSDGRIFGVELELTGPRARTIISALRDAGIPMSRRNLTTMHELPYGATNTESNVWTLKHDGSVYGYGLELVSPKLAGPAGFETLKTVCDTLNSIDATVDSSCGLHVHHDFRGLSLQSVRRQVVAFIERQDVIGEFIQPGRREHHTYTPRWSAQQIAMVAQRTSLSGLAATGPRGTLNMWAYSTHGSVELRWHGGTTMYKKIAAWVRFGQAIFAAAEAGATLSNDTPERLLQDLSSWGVTAEDAAWLLRFRTAGESRATVQARIEALQNELAAAESVNEEV